MPNASGTNTPCSSLRYSQLKLPHCCLLQGLQEGTNTSQPFSQDSGREEVAAFCWKKLIENKTKKTPPQHKNKPKNLLFSSSQLKSLFTRAQDTLMSCPWSLLIPAWKWLCLGTQVTSTKPLCWLHWQSSGNTIDLISSSKAPMEQAQQIPECPRII